VRDDSSFIQVAGQWLLVLFLALTLGLFFLFATAFQVTSDGPGHRILRRGVAITTEIDALLPQIQTQLVANALTAEGDQVLVPNFPVPVAIPKADAGRIEPAELRTRIIDQSADRLYEDGMSAWAAGDPESQQSISRASTAGGLHRAFGLVTEKWNTIFLFAAILFAFLSLLLFVPLWMSLRTYLRLLALGGAISVASITSLAAAVAIRFALRTAETESDPFEEQLIDLGVDTVWLFIRNYLILSALGFTILVLASVFLWLQSRSEGDPTVRPMDRPAF
jgi:hypothetical protein